MIKFKGLAGVLCVLLALSLGVQADEFRTIRSTNGKLVKSENPAFTVVSLSANDATPNITEGLIFVTGINTSATAILDFENPVVGNIITIVGNASTTTNATTIADSGNFDLASAFVASANNVLTVYVNADNDYVEISRSEK